MPPCACNKGKQVAGQSTTLERKHRVVGTGNPLVDKLYDSETEAQMALAKSGKTGTVKPA
jgi:hypothetical protein